MLPVSDSVSDPTGATPMPIEISCDECPFESEVKNALAGKRVKCPKCQAVIQVPAAVDEDDEPPARPKPKPRVVEEDEDDAPRPKPKKKPVVLEEDDADDAPRPMKRKAKARRDDDDEGDGGKSKLWLYVGIGAAVLLLGGIGIFLATRGKTPEVAKPNDPQPGPGPGGEVLVPDALPELKPRATLKTNLDVREVHLSGDGSRAVARDVRSGFEVWDLSGQPRKSRASTKPLALVMPNFREYYGVPDRDRILAPFEIAELDTDKVVRVLPETHYHFDYLAAQSEEVISVAKSSFGGGGGNRSEFRFLEWNLRTNALVERFKVPITEEFEFGGFADGGKLAVVGWRNSGQVHVWDVPSGKKQREFTVPKSNRIGNVFTKIEMSRDGKLLLVNDDGVRILDSLTGQRKDALPDKIFWQQFAFVPGREAVIGFYAQSDKSGPGFNNRKYSWAVYDLRKKSIVALLPTTEWSQVAMAADGRTIATWDRNKNRELGVQIWDIGEFVK